MENGQAGCIPNSRRVSRAYSSPCCAAKLNESHEQVGGQRELATYAPRWLYSLANHHNAIVVSLDHRLLPEANIHELLDDLDDFWAWVKTKLPGLVEGIVKDSGMGVKVDLERVLVTGESAGEFD